MPDDIAQVLDSSLTVSPQFLAKATKRSEPTILKGIRLKQIPSVRIGETENIPTSWVRKALVLGETP